MDDDKKVKAPTFGPGTEQPEIAVDLARKLRDAREVHRVPEIVIEYMSAGNVARAKVVRDAVAEAIDRVCGHGPVPWKDVVSPDNSHIREKKKRECAQWVRVCALAVTPAVLLDPSSWFMYDVLLAPSFPAPPSQTPAAFPDPALREFWLVVRDLLFGEGKFVGADKRFIKRHEGNKLDVAFVENVVDWTVALAAHLRVPVAFTLSEGGFMQFTSSYAKHIVTLYNACCRYAWNRGVQWKWGFRVRSREQLRDCAEAYRYLGFCKVETSLVVLHDERFGLEDLGQYDHVTITTSAALGPAVLNVDKAVARKRLRVEWGGGAHEWNFGKKRWDVT